MSTIPAKVRAAVDRQWLRPLLDWLDAFLGALDTEAAAFSQVKLTVGTEASNAIVVTGQLQDSSGANVAAAKVVVVETFAVSATEGAITVETGTEVANSGTPEGKSSFAVLTTTAAGAFAVSVADTAAEKVLVRCSVDGAIVAQAVLTFA